MYGGIAVFGEMLKSPQPPPPRNRKKMIKNGGSCGGGGFDLNISPNTAICPCLPFNNRFNEFKA